LARAILLAALWASIDLLRRILGQPWVLLGYSQSSVIGLIQVAVHRRLRRRSWSRSATPRWRTVTASGRR
jgi:hypothetical protein